MHAGIEYEEQRQLKAMSKGCGYLLDLFVWFAVFLLS